MWVLVLAATKGGVGKSTLSYALGWEAAKRGSVWFVDLDPQGSLTELCNRRNPKIDEGREHIPALLEPASTMADTLRALKLKGMERDFMIIDTPGSLMRGVLKDAISVADVIVLPVQPSPLDILAQEDAGQIIDEMGLASKTLFVINRSDSRSDIGQQTMDRIMGLFPNRPVKIAQRVDYSRASIGGRAAPEINKDAAKEINDLWVEIQSIMMKGKNHGQSEHEGSGSISPEKQRAG